MARPLYPHDGIEYERATKEAERLYEEWLVSRKDVRGMRLFTTRHNPVPDTEE